MGKVVKIAANRHN